MESLYDVSIILACYNEEPVLKSSIKKILETMDNTRWTYEIIFVDDCSMDKTRLLIEQIIENNPEHVFHKIFHENNTGRGRAVSDGLNYARGNYMGFLDVDLEVGAHYIPRMIIALQNGADVVSSLRICTPSLRLLIRIILSNGYHILVRTVLQLPLKDTEAGFKFFNRQKILPVLSTTKNPGWFWDTEIMARSYKAKLNIVELPCLFIRRYDKKSSVNLFRDTVQYMINLIQFKQEFR